MKIETIAVHAGHRPDPATGALREPLHLSTTFERGEDGTYPYGHTYARTSNPNRSTLEAAIAALEGGAECVAFASGTATTLAAFSLATPGGRVVCAKDCYYGTGKQLRDIVSRWNVRAEFVHTTQIDALERAPAPGAPVLWIEAASNPLPEVP